MRRSFAPSSAHSAHALLASTLLVLASCSLLSTADDLAGGAGEGGSAGTTASGDAGTSQGTAAGAAGIAGGGGQAGSDAVAGAGGGNVGGQAAGAAGAGVGGEASGGSSAAGAAGQPGGGSGGAAGPGAGGSGGAGGAAGTGGGAGAGTGGGGGLLGEGVIVAGGEIAPKGAGVPTLAVIDPRTGEMVASEPLLVAAIGYEPGEPGTAERWYVFTSNDTAEPTISSKVTLQTRTLDRATATWSSLGTLDVPPIIAGSLVVLRGQAAYLTYGATGASSRRVVLVDGLGTAAVMVQTSSTEMTVNNAQGLVGLNPTATAGPALDAMGLQQVPCPEGGPCGVQATSIALTAAGVSTEGTFALGSYAYAPDVQPAWTTTTNDDNRLLVAIPPPSMAQGSEIHAFRPAGPTNLGTVRTFSPGGVSFGTLLYDRCLDLAILHRRDGDGAVIALELSGAKASVTRAGGATAPRVFFEPSSRSVLVPDRIDVATPSLRAIRLSGSGSTLALTNRTTDWAAPAGFAVRVAAVRTEGSTCMNLP